MKKLLIVAALVCALSAHCFAIGSVVQGLLGGHASAASGSACASGLTATATYTNPTTIGNTLLVVIWFNIATANNESMATAVTTSGVTWTEVSGAFSTSIWDSTNHITKGTNAYQILDASSSIASSTNVTVTASGISSTVTNCNVEFALFELGGILATVGNAKFSGNANAGVTSSSPSVSVTTGFTGLTGFVICFFAGEGSTNLSAGSGYTLGPIAGTSVVGNVEYGSGKSPTVTAAFSGTNPFWGATLLWYEDGSSASAVKRHNGSVF